MSVFYDGALAFFSAVGMTAVVWIAAGALLHAGRPSIPGLLDCGLTGEAKALAEYLARREKDAVLTAADEFQVK